MTIAVDWTLPISESVNPFTAEFLKRRRKHSQQFHSLHSAKAERPRSGDDIDILSTLWISSLLERVQMLAYDYTVVGRVGEGKGGGGRGGGRLPVSLLSGHSLSSTAVLLTITGLEFPSGPEQY